MNLTVTFDATATPKVISQQLSALAAIFGGGGVELTGKTGKPAKTAKPTAEVEADDEDFDLDGEEDEGGDADEDGGEEDEGDADEGPSKEEVRQALNNVAKKKGKAIAMGILKTHKAKGVDDLKEKHYAGVIEMANKKAKAK